jgi:hypothetical protein
VPPSPGGVKTVVKIFLCKPLKILSQFKVGELFLKKLFTLKNHNKILEMDQITRIFIIPSFSTS